MRRALATIVAVAGALTLAPVAGADGVAVVVRDDIDLAAFAPMGAVGLLVPGSGETVSRKGALSALMRGTVTPALIGGVSEGEPLIEIAREPGAEVTIYVALPPPGTSPNDVRYPVAVVGRGFRGLLTSTSTRIPGLVSVADVAPTAIALDEGGDAPLGWVEDADPVGSTSVLDRRLAGTHDARDAATAALVAVALVLAAAAMRLASASLARATIAAPLVALGLGIALSAAGVSTTAVIVAVVAAATGPLALLAGRTCAVAETVLGVGLAAYLVVLVVSPQTAALAVIGPHPESGGRFYGVTNLVETMVLVALAAAVAVLPPVRAAGLAILALATVGWSEAGADGGGVVVLGAAVATAVVFRHRARPTLRNVLAAAACVAVGAVTVVLVDRVSGGSSHVTRAVGDGPGGLLDDVARRLEVSWHAATNNAHTVVICLVALAAVVVLAVLGPRTVAFMALLAGLVVSLAVNDSPPDVLVTAAIGLAAMVAAARARGRAPTRAVAP